MLDDLAEYRQAMWHFDQANAIKRRTARFDGPELAEHIDRLVARYTPDFFAASKAFGVRDETPLLIVGMPRSGTTLVEQIVSSHHQVAAGGELRFWVKRGMLSGIADREAVTRRLIAFTGLDWDDACLSPERNERTVRTASLWQARQPVYATSIARWRRYEPWLGELRELLPRAEDER